MLTERTRRLRRGAAVVASIMAGWAAAARADVVISDKPTVNMNCSGGICTATASKAMLNVSDLTNMLSSGDVAVKTGSTAKDIDVDATLSWTSTSRLTLDAQRSVMVKKQVVVAGQGALTITTNDTDERKKSDGEFIIAPERGSVQFWDLGSSLIVDGNSYTLVRDIKSLASDIASNPSGFYALAKPYDANADGTYNSAPIQTGFTGTFEGLGNTISGLTMTLPIDDNPGGFFFAVFSGGVIQDIGIIDVKIGGGGSNGYGALAGYSDGSIVRAWATGTMTQVEAASRSSGGLVGASDGTISNSFASVKIELNEVGELSQAGGLVGRNRGLIELTYADGSLTCKKAVYGMAFGGLVGLNEGLIENSFAVNSIHDGKQNDEVEVGGLVGTNQGGHIISSYAAGPITQHNDNSSEIGGLVGNDESKEGHIKSSYWDLDMGVSDPERGAGNRKNDPGITGLTTEQLQSGLPSGFDPQTWKQNSNKNHGLPYLAFLPVK